MHFTSQTTIEGVTERLFDLEVRGARVPGVLWSPEDTASIRGLLLLGHGGSLHKKAPGVIASALGYVRACGFAVVAIDAPNHGERPVSERYARFAAEMQRRFAEGKNAMAEISDEMAEQAVVAVPEWHAALDAIQTLDFIRKDLLVAYWGLSMGTAIGARFVAAEPRIAAAVLGLAGVPSANDTLAEAAARIAVPVEFVLQWDDEIVSREAGLALFNAIGSREKVLHANPGKHIEVPPAEREGWRRFFTRHLVRA